MAFFFSILFVYLCLGWVLYSVLWAIKGNKRYWNKYICHNEAVAFVTLFLQCFVTRFYKSIQQHNSKEGNCCSHLTEMTEIRLILVTLDLGSKILSAGFLENLCFQLQKHSKHHHLKLLNLTLQLPNVCSRMLKRQLRKHLFYVLSLKY